MMYNNMFTACLKANGKILREFGDTVRIPYGTEFSILLKNLNTVRAQVSISIDGESVTGTNVLVVNPNDDFELTRYIKNGNLTSGNRFKFIERTSNIEEYRGIKVDDGIVRIQFLFERKSQFSHLISNLPPSYPPHYRKEPYWLNNGTSYSADVSDGSIQCSASKGVNIPTSAAASLKRSVSSSTMDFVEVNDAGITVPGSISNQQFQRIDNFDVEPVTHVIVLKMLGAIETGEVVTQPITVKTQNKCPTCGTLNKIKAKFCSECATGLVVV